MTTTICRTNNVCRSYEANEKVIEGIYIYKDGEIILHTRRSWLEAVKENFDTEYCGDLLEVTMDGEIKRANKLNLNRKDNFILKTHSPYNINSGYSLFIYADNFLESWEELPKKYNDHAHTEDGKNFYLYGIKVKMKYPAKKHEPYKKEYVAGEKIEPEDRRRHFYNSFLTDENGKFVFDADGKLVRDKNKSYCIRYKEVEITDCNFYNGLYIKEGK
jgi:hypothetical protein